MRQRERMHAEQPSPQWARRKSSAAPRVGAQYSYFRRLAMLPQNRPAARSRDHGTKRSSSRLTRVCETVLLRGFFLFLMSSRGHGFFSDDKLF
jgi:hypothetical protein